MKKLFLALFVFVAMGSRYQTIAALPRVDEVTEETL